MQLPNEVGVISDINANKDHGEKVGKMAMKKSMTRKNMPKSL
jgi:hypothetical protein